MSHPLVVARWFVVVGLFLSLGSLPLAAQEEEVSEEARLEVVAPTEEAAPPASGSGWSVLPAQLLEPFGVAIDGQGALFVVDRGANAVVKLSASGEIAASWGSEGSGVGQFRRPSGIALDKQGNVYVSDTGNDRVQKFSSDGRPLAQWGSSGTAPGEFRQPNGVGVDGAGRLYVVDAGNNRVQALAPDGKPIAQYGQFTNGPRNMDNPLGITVDDRNPGQVTLYVVDVGNRRVQFFWTYPDFPGGTYDVSSMGVPECQSDSLGIAVDAQGILYIADNGVTKLNPLTGQQHSLAVEPGTGIGQFAGPRALAVDPRTGTVYMSDSGNGRIQSLTPSSWSF